MLHCFSLDKIHMRGDDWHKKKKKCIYTSEGDHCEPAETFELAKAVEAQNSLWVIQELWSWSSLEVIGSNFCQFF